MSRHSFAPEIAVQVGLNAAVIYQNLCFWIEKNEANWHNFRDGRFWTYNSIAAFAKLFPYFTAKQVRTAIDKLVETGLILKGAYGDDKYDRTAWYALNTPICPERQIELPQRADDGFAPEGKGSAPEGKSLRNRYNPDTKPDLSRAAPQEVVVEADFQLAWDAYPHDRRRNLPRSREYLAQALTEVSVTELVAAINAYAAESASFTRSKVSFIDNWLRDGKWRRHVDDLRRQDTATSAAQRAAKERVLLTQAEWIRARNPLCRTLTDANMVEIVSLGLVSQDEAQAARGWR